MKNKNVIHQLTSQTHSQMMSYVIETKDDKIIVIDGGTIHDTNYLFDYIKNLSNGKLHINAWILTHIHSDHIGAIIGAFADHENEFTAEKIYYNFPTVEMVMEFDHDNRMEAVEFEKIKPKINPVTQTLRTDDVLDFGEIKFKVLSASDFSVHDNFINNTSTVLKMFADGQTMIFLGDLGIESGLRLLETKSDEMRSDFVQMAHHGQNGVTFEVYETINPKVCFWDTPLWLWNNDAGKGYNTHIWQTVIVRSWIESLGVKYHFVTKDGTNRVELPFIFD